MRKPIDGIIRIKRISPTSHRKRTKARWMVAPGLAFMLVFGAPLVQAFFSDVEILDGGTITAGTLEFSLVVDGNTEIPSGELLDKSRKLPFELKNDGTINIQYKVKAVGEPENPLLCKSFFVETQRLGGSDGTVRVPISELQIGPLNMSSTTDKWNFFIILPKKLPRPEKNCIFHITFYGWQAGKTEGVGFSHEESFDIVVLARKLVIEEPPKEPDKPKEEPVVAEEPVEVVEEEAAPLEEQVQEEPVNTEETDDAVVEEEPAEEPKEAEVIEVNEEKIEEEKPEEVVVEESDVELQETPVEPPPQTL